MTKLHLINKINPLLRNYCSNIIISIINNFNNYIMKNKKLNK